MPKTPYSPRNELICGKLDEAHRMAVELGSVQLVEILSNIRHDAERMEQKLISRKEQVLALKEGISSERWENWKKTFNI